MMAIRAAEVDAKRKLLERIKGHAEPALQARADEPTHAVLGERMHPTRGDDLGPLLEQFAPPLVVPARGARQRQRPHSLGVQHTDDLRDHAAHRRADDVGAVDALGVEHLDRVACHA